MSKKKKDLSVLGNILSDEKVSQGKKPSSLSEFMQPDINKNLDENQEHLSSSEKKIVNVPMQREKVRDSLSLYKEDIDLIDQMLLKSSTVGQKATKADVYRASIKYLSNLSPESLANKIKDVRKNKKTHN